MSAVLRLFLIVAVIAMIPANSQRSPYVPQPWNYPGLLPRFGGGDQGGESSATTTTTTSAPAFRPRPNGGINRDQNLGNRIGGRPQRVNPDRAPCLDCLVYITSSGEILRVAKDQTPIDNNAF